MVYSPFPLRHKGIELGCWVACSSSSSSSATTTAAAAAAIKSPGPGPGAGSLPILLTCLMRAMGSARSLGSWNEMGEEGGVDGGVKGRGGGDRSRGGGGREGGRGEEQGRENRRCGPLFGCTRALLVHAHAALSQ